MSPDRPSSDAASGLVEGAAIQVQEAAAGLRGYLADLNVDPGLIEQIEARLGRSTASAASTVAPRRRFRTPWRHVGRAATLEQADLSAEH